jgi:hypothetical protein
MLHFPMATSSHEVGAVGRILSTFDMEVQPLWQHPYAWLKASTAHTLDFAVPRIPGLGENERLDYRSLISTAAVYQVSSTVYVSGDDVLLPWYPT